MKFQAFFFTSLFFLVYALVHSSLGIGSVQVVKTITVDKSGNGNFKSIQKAINSVPDGNSQWIRIHVHQGNYTEQVKVPTQKRFILLEGEGSDSTIIQWNAHTMPNDKERETAALIVSADNFIARNIAFQNSYDYKSHPDVGVAAAIEGDKCSFYNCKFLGYQDTLCDYQGRHYFKQCWIEGGIDFIYGRAASIYEGCTLNSILVDNGPGFFTAHGKVNLSAPGGFVFKGCKITGSGNMYLGRPWNDHSTVLFYETYMSDIVVPLGWDSWRQHNMSQVTYAEESCTGPGSNKGQRVQWEKQLSAEQWENFLGSEFINQDGWIEQQTMLKSTSKRLNSFQDPKSQPTPKSLNSFQGPNVQPTSKNADSFPGPSPQPNMEAHYPTLWKKIQKYQDRILSMTKLLENLYPTGHAP
ncbi:hypothetical protein LUZ61_017220 [Rhynchospora tenuis]|uniref:pectinesterase n=1 Tax=Rhynchospora tenuis TaxID=198213 RepID=A0AAD5Z701_9POAL|nr:hypothetical protein LUZ61_017220 [Rhynchospora tenuis]